MEKKTKEKTSSPRVRMVACTHVSANRTLDEPEFGLGRSYDPLSLSEKSCLEAGILPEGKAEFTFSLYYLLMV